MWLPLIAIRPRKVGVVGGDKGVRVLCEVRFLRGGLVELEYDGVGDTVLPTVEWRGLFQPTLDDAVRLDLRLLDDLTGDEELTDFPEVPGRHRSDERGMPADVFDDLHGMTIVVAAVGHEILSDLPKPARDTGRHRRLYAGFVAVEFFNDYGRDQQL